MNTASHPAAFLSPRDFGAKGDGSTRDTRAVQAAYEFRNVKDVASPGCNE